MLICLEKTKAFLELLSPNEVDDGYNRIGWDVLRYNILANTGQWFFNDKKFKEWRYGSQALLICARKGALFSCFLQTDFQPALGNPR